MGFYRYLIALGSNMDDRRSAMDTAVAKIKQCGELKAVSNYYETEPVGAADQLFLNAACLLESSLVPTAMMEKLLNIETAMGRVRTVKWGNRTIDLDIIMAIAPDGSDVLLRTADLALPHPHALERSFVIIPAADVCPTWKIPGSQQTFAEMRQNSFKT